MSKSFCELMFLFLLSTFLVEWLSHILCLQVSYVININLLMCPIYKLSFSIGMYVYIEKSIVYIGFRFHYCPWFQVSTGGLRMYPLWIEDYILLLRTHVWIWLEFHWVSEGTRDWITSLCKLYYFCVFVLERKHLVKWNIFCLFLRFYLFIFRERGKEGERDINVCLPLTRPPTGDLAHNPGMCSNWELNWWPFATQPMLNPLSYTSQWNV